MNIRTRLTLHRAVQRTGYDIIRLLIRVAHQFYNRGSFVPCTVRVYLVPVYVHNEAVTEDQAQRKNMRRKRLDRCGDTNKIATSCKMTQIAIVHHYSCHTHIAITRLLHAVHYALPGALPALLLLNSRPLHFQCCTREASHVRLRLTIIPTGILYWHSSLKYRFHPKSSLRGSNRT